MNRPTVSLIICCYTQERLQDILEAVASIERQTCPPEEIILVVDNNQTLYDLLRNLNLGELVHLILHQGLCGSAGARNAGAVAATGDIIVFLDDDAVADQKWLERLLEALEDGVLVVGGKATLKWPRGRPKWFPEELDWLLGGTYKGYRDNRGLVRNVHIHNMAILRSVFMESGMLRTDAGGGGGMVGINSRGGEEAELCHRLVRKFPKAKIMYEPEARIWHKTTAEKVSFRKVISRSYGEGFYKAWLANSTSKDKGVTLSTEKAYLRYLLLRAIPSRLAGFWHVQALAQAAAIVTCIIAVGIGHILGRRHFRFMSTGRQGDTA